MNCWGGGQVKHFCLGVDRQNFLSFWTVFLPFYPPNNLKNQNLEKLNKKSRHIIILHKCIKNHDHMLYSSLDMVRDGCNCYLSLWAIFCPFTPLTATKIKILQKWKKKHGDIIMLHMCTKNYDQMIYGS